MDGSPKRPGRPRQDPGRAKTVMVNVRISPDEADRLYVHAQRHRVTVAELTRGFYRRLLRDEATKPDGSS